MHDSMNAWSHVNAETDIQRETYIDPEFLRSFHIFNRAKNFSCPFGNTDTMSNTQQALFHILSVIVERLLN